MRTVTSLLAALALLLSLERAHAQSIQVPDFPTQIELAAASTDLIPTANRMSYLTSGDSAPVEYVKSASACSTTAFQGSGSVPFSSDLLTVSSVTSGELRPGLVVSIPNLPAGTVVLAFVSGTGGTGTYRLSNFAPPTMPPTVTVTAKGDGMAQVPSVNGKCWLAVLPGAVFPVDAFGATCTGTSEDGPAIRAAIAAAGAAGGGSVKFPLKTCSFATGLVVGDGSAAAVSTISNVKFTSDAVPNFFAGNGFSLKKPILRYTGSGVNTTIQGPLVGWGLQNLVLQCTNSAAVGVKYISAMKGDNYNLTVSGCKLPAFPSSVASLPPGIPHVENWQNTWRNFSFDLPGVDGAIGLWEDSDGFGNTDESHWQDGTLSFQAAAGGAVRQCIRLGFADSSKIRNVICVRGGGDAGFLNGVLFDYTVNGASGNFPNGISLEGIDVGTTDTQYANLGAPNAVTGGVNFLDNIITGNGGTYPFLSGLSVNHSKPLAWTATPRGSTVAGAPTFTGGGWYTFDGYGLNAWWNLDITALGGMAGNLLQTLPQAGRGSLTLSTPCSVVHFGGWLPAAAYTAMFGLVAEGTSTMQYWEQGPALVGQQLPITDIAAGFHVVGECHYMRENPPNP